MNYTLSQILSAANSLFDGSDMSEDTAKAAYARGVCELIGRLRLDIGGKGETTYDNARLAAIRLGLADNFIWRIPQ